MTPTPAHHPLVSVVVPTMDRPEMLRRALLAVLQQDYKGPIEVIVVFDGVEPSVPDLDLPPQRSITALVNSRTPGLAGNRNTGILMARGDYVAFCDDDDEWLPSKITKQVAALAGSDRHFLSSTGIVTVRPGRPDVERVLPYGEVTHQMLLRSRLMEVHSSTLVFKRRELLEKVGLVDEELPGGFGEDYDILLRSTAIAPIQLVPEALVRVDLHPKSYFAEQWQTMVESSHYMLNRYPAFLTEPKGVGRIYGRLAIAKAALGERREAWHYVRRSLSKRLIQPRPYIAAAILLKLLTPDAAVRVANRFGRGV